VHTKRSIAALAVVGVIVLGASACSQRYSAERDGKKAGQAVCDIKSATTAEEAQAAKDNVNKQLDDLNTKYALATAEDRKDIQNNLADLAEHSIQGNALLREQDLTVLQRSVRHIADDSDEVARAAWDGFNEGLEDCINT
jgi:hypothetical protein